MFLRPERKVPPVPESEPSLELRSSSFHSLFIRLGSELLISLESGWSVVLSRLRCLHLGNSGVGASSS